MRGFVDMRGRFFFTLNDIQAQKSLTRVWIEKHLFLEAAMDLC